MSNISNSAIDVALKSSYIDCLDAREKSVLSVVGHALMCHQQSSDAIYIFEAIRFVDPGDRYAMRILVHLYIELGRYLDALDLAKEYKLSDPMDFEINNYICGLLECKALWALGRENEARLCFREYQKYASIEK